ncbi:ribonuclease HII [Protaetiibacter sp. SSC-01]|uniref:ribonuclease HII n=1 Tax=Protaetiibacter sp. SSC-01 TaxID=2759943 RepID=UPI001656E538|nr:ribonuclease HII [Protaetiibacter sp. SSC-01]QNO38237.1 ribonuclease HII [Protaetiibacter sp. SSC-01]
MTAADPTLRMERGLFRDGAALVIGVDEVGRGAIAGPVAVGLGVFLPDVKRMPKGLRDSKLLSEQRREELHPEVLAWAPHSAVGLASNAEVDTLGIIAGLGLAAVRGIEALVAAGVPVEAAVVVLDGSHDWLTPALADCPDTSRPRVVTRVKADRDCASVAAASVLAKVHRDRLMIDADGVHPGYEWTSNKGYASATHYAAIDRLGASALHRWSWLKQPALF